jgi:CspA family cold shock protein
MTHYGKINSYNSASGSGTIAPEQGSDMLSFRKADLRQQSEEPRPEQRYGYETQSSGDGGKQWAVRLERQQA